MRDHGAPREGRGRRRRAHRAHRGRAGRVRRREHLLPHGPEVHRARDDADVRSTPPKRAQEPGDIAALNAALSDAESDDGGAFYASLPKPRPPDSDDDNGGNGAAAAPTGDGDSEGDFDA